MWALWVISSMVFSTVNTTNGMLMKYFEWWNMKKMTWFVSNVFIPFKTCGGCHEFKKASLILEHIPPPKKKIPVHFLKHLFIHSAIMFQATFMETWFTWWCYLLWICGRSGRPMSMTERLDQGN